MASSTRAPDIRSPPTDFDEFVAWFEGVSLRLVLLEEYSRPDIESVVRRAQSVLTDHMQTVVPALSDPPEGLLADLHRILVSDHAWFLRSVEQLGWFWSIVEGEDHGGHRQALGQYGRILAEAVRRHRSDERAYRSGVETLAALRPKKP